MPDVTRLILDDHETLRRRFADLDDAQASGRPGRHPRPPGSRSPTCSTCTPRPRSEVFYPKLLEYGLRPRAEDETEDAIEDHNKIRQGVRDAPTARSGRTGGGRRSAGPAPRTASTSPRRSARRCPTSASPCPSTSATGSGCLDPLPGPPRGRVRHRGRRQGRRRVPRRARGERLTLGPVAVASSAGVSPIAGWGRRRRARRGRRRWAARRPRPRWPRPGRGGSLRR